MKMDLADAAVFRNDDDGLFYFTITGFDGKQIRSKGFESREQANEECVKALKILGELMKRSNHRIVSIQVTKVPDVEMRGEELPKEEKQDE